MSAEPGHYFSDLSALPPDSLLSLIRAYELDSRSSKVDLGVGVYRTEDGRTPVLQAVKGAERHLLEHQQTKAYLGPEGDVRFLELLEPLIFGPRPASEVLASAQTPGGTGALRLAADLVKASQPGARVYLGVPSWPIHEAILRRCGLEIITYRHMDPATGRLDFDALSDALKTARSGDVVLLHACCHNPTGVDPTRAHWRQIAEIISRTGVLPLVDLAYHGLGDGLTEDAEGARQVFEAAASAILTYSCDKNFGLYRERTGAIFVKATGRTEVVQSNLLAIARTAWSMPPDHGAAVVRIILDDTALSRLWREELAAMRARLNALRGTLSARHARLTSLADHKGLFAMLPVSPDHVQTLREQFGVYMAGSGRINIAGLNPGNLDHFIRAFDTCLSGDPK